MMSMKAETEEKPTKLFAADKKDVKWTKAQLEAITLKRHRHSCSARRPAPVNSVSHRAHRFVNCQRLRFDVSRILAVTFTKAAAVELKAVYRMPCACGAKNPGKPPHSASAVSFTGRINRHYSQLLPYAASLSLR